jgi:hypothetical protein
VKRKQSGLLLTVVVLFTLVLAGCASFGHYSPDMPDCFIGRIHLHLLDYGPRTGIYARGIYASIKNKETGDVSSFALDSDGFFASYDLEAGTYLFEGLFVDQFVLPNTRNFHISFKEFELTIEKDQVNVFGDLVVSYVQSGKTTSDWNIQVDDMKALFAAKAPDSQWLTKPWRSVFPGPKS